MNCLAEKLVDWIAFDNLDWPTRVRGVLRFRRHTHGRTQCRKYVGHAYRVLFDCRSVFAGTPVSLPASDAATCQHAGPGFREMVAPRLGVYPRRAPELAHPYNR